MFLQEQEVRNLAEDLKKQFPNPPEPTDPIWSMQPALKVVDCVLSLNRNYDKVVWPRIKQLAENHPALQKCADLVTLIRGYDTPLAFSQKELNYNGEKRAQILLNVAEYLVSVQRNHVGDSEDERLQRWAETAGPDICHKADIFGFKLAGFQYLRMLFGAQTTKPDVHIIQFVSDAVGRKVNDLEALRLLERAADLAGMRLRNLDVVIWEQKARGVMLCPNGSGLSQD